MIHKTHRCLDINKIYNIFSYCLPGIIVFLICLYRIGEHQYPVIYGDEYGYWAAGSFFAGLHWEEITTINPYYGYGYGMFLGIILKIVNNPIWDYKIALYCNAITMGIIYCIVLKVEKNLLRFEKFEMNELLQVLIAMTITCYSSNLQYVNYTMAEIPTVFFTWLGFLCITNCLEQKNIINEIILLLVAVFMVMIHMRNIGFFIFAVAFIAYTNIIEKKRHYLIGFIIISLLGIAVFSLIKNFYTNQYYIEISGVMHNTTNELSGVVDRILSIMSISSIKKLIISALGKIYYFVIASYGLCVFPTFVAFQTIKKLFKRKRICNFEFTVLLGVAYSVIMILICSIYMIEYDKRFDLLLYGRYFENSIPFIMLIGIIIIASNKSICNFKLLSFSVIVITILAFVAEMEQNYSLPKVNVFANLTPVAGWLIKHNYSSGSYLALGLILNVLLLSIFIIGNFNILKIKTLLILIGSFWMLFQEVKVAHYVLDNGFFVWSIDQNKSDLDILDKIYELRIQDNLFFLPSKNVLAADGLQYLLKYHTINVIQNIDGTEDYVLTDDRDNVTLEMHGYEIIEESQRLVLWGKKE